MKAMILAAGLGTRLRPLTEEISKPMVPIVNKPVMEHIVELLAKYGIGEIVVNLHYHPQAIQNHFGDGSRWGVSLTYSLEEELLGTAGGVRKVKDFFGDETFLIVSGDTLTDIDLDSLFKFHQTKGAVATIAVKEVEDPSRYGVVITSEKGKVINFQEKPAREEARSKLANNGIYVLEPEVLDLIPEGVFYDFGRQLFPLMVERKQKVYGFEHDDYWDDVGTLEDYQKSNFDALEGKVKVNIPGNKVNDERIWIGNRCHIEEEVILASPVCIGNGCIIKKHAKLLGPVIIGDNTVVDERAVLHQGIKWGEGYVGKDVSLVGGIVGKHTRIGDKAVIKKDAVIGGKCIIGRDSVIHPSVIITSNETIKKGSQIKPSSD